MYCFEFSVAERQNCLKTVITGVLRLQSFLGIYFWGMKFIDVNWLFDWSFLSALL